MNFLQIILGIKTAVAAPPLPIQQVNIDPCGSFAGLSCATDLPTHIANIFLSGPSNVRTIFGVVLFAMLTYYGIKLIVTSREDSAQADAIQSYVNAIIGTALVAGASIVATIVMDHTTIVNTTGINNSVSALGKIALFMRNMVVGLVILNLFIQGFKLVIAQDDGEASSAQKGLIRSLLGVVIVMICGPIINAVVPSGALSGTITDEIVGVANYVVTIFGALSVLAFIIAGMFYVMAIDSGLKDRAHKLMIASIVSVLVVLASYSLLHIFF